MRYYVNTRGTQKELDYRWYEVVEEKGLTVNEPKLVQEINEKNLLDEGSFSLILYQENSDVLCLSVSNLPAPKRPSDYVGRKITNNLIWVTTNQEESYLLQYIAVAFLDDFQNTIEHLDDIIKPKNNAEGFSVDFTKLDEFTNKYRKEKVLKQSSTSTKISKNTEERRKELANILKENQLPSSDETYSVIVTGYTDQKTLETVSVLYALTNLIESECWIELSKKKPHYSQTSKQSLGKISLALGIGIVAIGLVSFFQEMKVKEQKITGDSSRTKDACGYPPTPPTQIIDECGNSSTTTKNKIISHRP